MSRSELGLKATEVSELHTVPAQQLLAAYTAVEQRLDSRAREKGQFEQHGFVPTVGVGTLPMYPFDPIAPEVSASVPLLIGTNRHETALFTRTDPKIYNRTLTEEERGLRSPGGEIRIRRSCRGGPPTTPRRGRR